MLKQKIPGTQQLSTSLANSNQTISQTAISFSPIKQGKSNSLTQLEVFQCKICLAQVISARKQKEKIISPCNCTGSMKFVHNECLVSWLNSIVKRNLQKGENTQSIFCQICKLPYEFQTTYKFKCCPAEQIKQQIKLNWGILTLGIIFILGSIIGSILLGIQVAEKKFSIKEDGSVMQIMFISIIILFAIIVIAWSLRLTFALLVKKIFYVKKVFEKEQIQRAQIDNSNNTINISI